VRQRQGRGRRTFIYLAASLPTALFVALLTALLLQPPAAPPVANITQVTERGEAPDFVGKRLTPQGLSGEEFRFSSTRGRIVFLEFAWWRCPVCNRMAPVVRELYNEFSGKGVVFVTVMIDDLQSSVQDNARYIASHEIPWTVVWDEGGSIQHLYDVSATPTYFIVNPEGRVVRVLTGAYPKEAISGILNMLLG